MSDQGFYQRNINASGSGVQSFTEAGEIAGGVTVVKADTNSGVYLMTLPDQIGNAGVTIVAVNLGGGNVAGVGVQVGDSINGTVDGSSAFGAAVLDFGVYTSMGADGWVRVL